MNEWKIGSVLRRKLRGPRFQICSSSVPIRPRMTSGRRDSSWGLSVISMDAAVFQDGDSMRGKQAQKHWNPIPASFQPFPNWLNLRGQPYIWELWGSLVALSHFTWANECPERLSFLHYHRTYFPQFLCWGWFLPPGTQQCGYFLYKSSFCERTFIGSLRNPFLLCGMTCISKVQWSHMTFIFVKNKGVHPQLPLS